MAVSIGEGIEVFGNRVALVGAPHAGLGRADEIGRTAQ
jgi:hypothetical protein